MCSKAVKECETKDAIGGILSDEQATNFRALAARANYLALDRPDLAFSTQELCRAFSRPTTVDVEALKRMVRYLVHYPRLFWHYKWGQGGEHIDAYCDTDFAGCRKARRSTSGGVLAMGGRILRHWSTTQPTIALSSGEAELSGIIKAASMGLGFQSLAADMGMQLKLRIHTDSMAVIGICRRRGLGKVRHISVGDLWMQERVKNGDFEVLKSLGSENPADIFTKFIERPILDNMLTKLNPFHDDGRASSAPQVAAIPYLIQCITSRKLKQLPRVPLG